MCCAQEYLFLAVVRACSLQFAFDGGVQGLWDFPVPHDQKKVFGKGDARASFLHGVCIRRSSGVLRTLYTYSLYTAGRVCERVIHVASQYCVSVQMCWIIFCPQVK